MNVDIIDEYIDTMSIFSYTNTHTHTHSLTHSLIHIHTYICLPHMRYIDSHVCIHLHRIYTSAHGWIWQTRDDMWDYEWLLTINNVPHCCKTISFQLIKRKFHSGVNCAAPFKKKTMKSQSILTFFSNCCLLILLSICAIFNYVVSEFSF